MSDESAPLNALGAFERYLRAREDSGVPPMPGAEVYRRLMRANLQTVIDNAFPVTVTSPSAWVTAVGRYCWKAVYTGNTCDNQAFEIDEFWRNNDIRRIEIRTLSSPSWVSWREIEIYR